MQCKRDHLACPDCRSKICQCSEAIGKKRASAMQKAITGVVLPYKHVECNEELRFIDMSDHVA